MWETQTSLWKECLSPEKQSSCVAALKGHCSLHEDLIDVVGALPTILRCTHRQKMGCLDPGWKTAHIRQMPSKPQFLSGVLGYCFDNPIMEISTITSLTAHVDIARWTCSSELSIHLQKPHPAPSFLPNPFYLFVFPFSDNLEGPNF